VGAFGEKLRKQREQRGLELDAISNTTKISTRMLRALEDEHFDQLPGGVFNKGFVRAYARQIGLNEEEAVTDYLAALRESQIQQQSILPDFRSPASKPIPPVAPPGLRENVIPTPDLRTHDLPTHDLRTHDLRTEDHDNDDADDIAGEPRTENRRKQERRLEARRNEDRRNQDRVIADPAKEARVKEDQTEDRDFSAPKNFSTQPRERFPQKYPAGSPGEPADQSTAVPWGKLALTLLVVTVALALWNFTRRAHPAPTSQPPASSTQSPAVSTPGLSPKPSSASSNSLTVRPATAEKNRSAGTVSSESISAPATPHQSPSSRTVAAPSTPVHAAKPESPGPSSSASTGGAKPAANPSQPDLKPAIRAKGRVAPAKPPSTFTLLIRAQETTWISLAADGKPIAHETLIAPAHTSLRATHEIIVRAGNSAGISFVLNGREIPAQGNEGEVRTYTFDATGLRTTQTTTQQQPPAANR